MLLPTPWLFFRSRVENTSPLFLLFSFGYRQCDFQSLFHSLGVRISNLATRDSVESRNKTSHTHTFGIIVVDFLSRWVVALAHYLLCQGPTTISEFLRILVLSLFRCLESSKMILVRVVVPEPLPKHFFKFFPGYVLSLEFCVSFTKCFGGFC
jgi:hypothetical protein